MRCSICNTLYSMKSSRDICENCESIILEIIYPPQEPAVSEDYSVIPSDTDEFGRVRSYKYE